MSAFIGLGFAAFFLVATVVGLRLLALWWHSGELPELLIAGGVLGIGSFGFAFSVFAFALMQAHPGVSRALWSVAFLSMNAGGACTYVFTWTVFRRGEGWALALVLGLCAVFAVTWLAELASTGFVFDPDFRQSLPMQVSSWARVGALGWGAFESLRYWAMMRRRARLGLGNPVVENRFLLWGLGIGAAGWGVLLGTLLPLLAGVAPMDPELQLSNSLHGLAAAVAMWFAFVPPARYLAWISRRGAARAAAP
jgi:hypothetical protein